MTDNDQKELAALREFAAGKCTIRKVIDELGPMSLWSNDAFNREIQKAKEQERKRWDGVKEYLTAAAAGSMSRNNSENLAAELLRQIQQK